MKLKLSVLLLAFTLSVISIIIIGFASKVPAEPSFRCNAVIFQSRYFKSSDNSTYASIKIEKKQNLMRVYLNGRFLKDSEKYVLIRAMDYAIKNSAGEKGSFTLTLSRVIVSPSDTMPSASIDLFFPYITPGKEYIVKISQLSSGDLLFTSQLGPFFICDIDE